MADVPTSTVPAAANHAPSASISASTSNPHSPAPDTPSSTVPQKRPYDSSDSKPSEPPKPMLKSKPPREKKDSWKKKEAAAAAASGLVITAHTNPTAGAVMDGTAKKTSTPPQPALPPPGLQRWRLPKPQDADYEAAKPPLMVPSNVPGADIGCEFFSLTEQYVPPPPSSSLWNSG